MEILGVFVHGYLVLAGLLGLLGFIAWVCSRPVVGTLKKQSVGQQKVWLAIFGAICLLLALWYYF